MRHAALCNTTCPEREAASEMELKATSCKAMSDMRKFQTYDMNIIRESQVTRKSPLSASLTTRFISLRKGTASSIMRFSRMDWPS